MTNEQLVILIKAGENTAANMEQLYNQVKDFIHMTACRFRGAGELEDLEQEGYLALYPAIDGYDPEKGVKFLTYAEWHIRQRIQRYIQNSGSCVRLPVWCLNQQRKYKKFVNAFLIMNGREPTDEEAARYMHFSIEQVKGLQESACMMRIGSLDTPVKGTDGGDDFILADMVPAAGSMEEDVLDRVEQEELHYMLWGCVDKLPGQQPEVIRMRYIDCMTLTDIARTIGRNTPESVRQIHNKALRELRKPRNAKQLRSFLPETDRIYSSALHGNGSGHFSRTWTSSTERTALQELELLEKKIRNELEELEVCDRL